MSIGRYVGVRVAVAAGDVERELPPSSVVGVGDDRHVIEEVRGLDGHQLGIARADADEVERAGHGFTASHWVTAMRGRSTRCVPTRVERRHLDAREIAAVDRVAGIERGLALDRDGVGDEAAARAKGAPGRGEERIVADVAAEEDGIGRGLPANVSGASPGAISRPGTPSFAALTAIICSRSPSRSKATARASRAARIHSMPIEPQPAPTSQSSAPG